MKHSFRTLALLGALAALQPAHADGLDAAKTALGKGDVKTGVIELKSFLQSNPQSADGWLLLGETYMKLGDIPNTVRAYEKVRDLQTPKEKWLLPLGRAYLLLNDSKSLFANIQPTEDLPPPLRAQVHGLIGSAYLTKSDPGKARENYDAALKIDPDASEALLGLAMLEAQQKQYKSAIEYTQRVLAKDPKNSSAWVIGAEAKRLQGDNDGALEAFNQALQISSSDPRARLGRATLYLTKHQLDEAAKDIVEVRKVAGEQPMALYLQAVIDSEHKKYEDAETLLHKVLSAMPDHLQAKWLLGTVAYQLGKNETAEKELTEFLSQVPGHPQASKLLAAIRVKQGRPADAIAVLKPLEPQLKDDPQYLSMLGSAYLQTRELDLGNEYLTRAAELAPKAGAIKAQLALGQIATGKLDQAAIDLKSAVELDPNLLQADMMLVLTLIQQKKYDEAIEAAQKLKTKMPDSPLPDNLLGAAYLSKDDKDKAIAAWQAALKINPAYYTAYLNLARLELGRKNPDAAIKHYESILQRDPKHPQALIGLAEIAEQRKDYAKMEKYLLEARDKNPKALQPALLLSRYYLQQRQTLRAMDIARDLYTHYPENPLVQQSLGMTQLANDQAASAVATFKKLVNQAPQNPEFRQQLAQSLYRAGDRASAVREWQGIRKEFPDLVTASVAMGEFAVQDKKFDEALKLAEELKTKNPKLAAGWQLEGDAQLARGEAKKAVSAYDKAYQMTPTADGVRRLYQAQRTAGNYENAFDTLNQWLKAHPDDFEAWLLLGMGYEGAGKLQEAKDAFGKGYTKDAIAAYEKALTLKPDNPLVMNNLAWVYHQIGDPRALELAEKLLPASEKYPQIMDTVGWIMVQNGKLDKGLTLLQDAAVHAPQEPSIRIHVAEALIKAGRKEDASNTLVLLLKEKKEFPERKQAEALLKGL